jgi:hypothetical protein
LFFLNPLGSFKFGIPILDYTVLLPTDIILGNKYSIDYYHQIGHYACSIDIAKHRNTIIDNIIKTKYVKSKITQRLTFSRYLEKYYANLEVDTIDGSDSSLFILTGCNAINGEPHKLNIHMGLNSEGWNEDAFKFAPPIVSFVEMVQKRDNIVCHVTRVISEPDHFYNPNKDNIDNNERKEDLILTVQLMTSQTAEFYYSRSQSDNNGQ